MAKILLFATVLAFLATAQGCNTVCSTSGTVKGRCYYECTELCGSLETTTLRDRFLTALEEQGFECGEEDASGLSCAGTAQFGACGAHIWRCGDDC